MELREEEIGRYTIILDGELKKNHFKGDITISSNDVKHYRDVAFDDISCILEGGELIREAYVMGISEDLEYGRRVFDDKWRNGFCLFRHFNEVCKSKGIKI